MSVAGYLSLLVVWSLVSAAGLVASLLATNPLEIGPFGVTMWFVVVLFALAGVFTLVLYTTKTFLHLHASGASRLRYSWRQGLLVGGWVTGMLSLSSLGQLGWLDAMLLGLMLTIIEVYVRLRWP